MTNDAKSDPVTEMANRAAAVFNSMLEGDWDDNGRACVVGGFAAGYEKAIRDLAAAHEIIADKEAGAMKPNTASSSNEYERYRRDFSILWGEEYADKLIKGAQIKDGDSSQTGDPTMDRDRGAKLFGGGLFDDASKRPKTSPGWMALTGTGARCDATGKWMPEGSTVWIEGGKSYVSASVAPGDRSGLLNVKGESLSSSPPAETPEPKDRHEDESDTGEDCERHQHLEEDDESRDSFICSFCGKSATEVNYLIAGPAVYICDECVFLCVDIVRENARRSNTGQKS